MRHWGQKYRTGGIVFMLGVIAMSGMLFCNTWNTLRAEEHKDDSAEITHHFSRYSHSSKQTLNFQAFDKLLQKIVWDTGPSNRLYAFRPWISKAEGSSRIVQGNKNPTRLEGNRIFYHILTDNNLNEIEDLLLGLQEFPRNKPLSSLNRDEQLAYWLNLHNLAVISLVAQNYHIPNLKELYRKSAEQKSLNVDSIALSLNDVKYQILAPIWKDTAIIYGLFYGAVGGPNINKRAFYGRDVHDQLRNNGTEFVNSLRGIRFRKNTLLVSPLYEWNYSQFNFTNIPLMTHLQSYAKGEVADRLPTYSQMQYAKFDWYIADLFNGKRPEALRPNAMPPLVAQLIENVLARNLERKATVEIEEYVDD